MAAESSHRKFTNEKGEEKSFTVFLIHGHSPERDTINQFIKKVLKYKTIVSVEQFTGGFINQKIKKAIWHECQCAVAILSPDDKLDSGKHNARQNVIYEIGYCEGYWDHFYGEDASLEPVVMIKEDSVELNSDLQGIEYLPYSAGNIESVFMKLTMALGQIYDYVSNPQATHASIKDKSAANDFIIIKNYLRDKDWVFISFEKLQENVHPRFTEEYVMKLVEKFPDKIRRSKQRTGKIGIRLLPEN